MQKFVNIMVLSILLAANHSQAAEIAPKAPVAKPAAVTPETIALPNSPEERNKIVHGPPAVVVEPEISEKFALNGFSAGGIAYYQSFESKVAATFSRVESTLTGHIADVQFIGAFGRYSVIPVENLGTDFSLGMATSINHASLNYGPLFTVKAEVNFTWAWLLENRKPWYGMLGFGYEAVKGGEFEKIVAPNGAVIQLGAGMVYSKTLNFEGVFEAARHNLTSKYTDAIAANAIAEGATSANIDTGKSFVTSYVLKGRVVYKY